MLLARIYEAFPLHCPICHTEMRIIAFINDAGTVKKILDHIGESTQPPRKHGFEHRQNSALNITTLR